MTRKDDPFNLEGLRLVPSAERAARRKRQFIKVPLIWNDRLGAARNATTFKLALRLLLLHFRDRGRPAQLGNLALGLADVSRMQKHRALVELEELGLVRVERRPRRSPVVTVILEPE